MRTRTMMRAMLAVVLGMLAMATVGGAGAQSKKRITVPAGTRVLIRMVDTIDSSKQKAGFRFTATLGSKSADAGVR